jgi:Mn2+/Fe2+ NRAMP family transporter
MLKTRGRLLGFLAIILVILMLVSSCFSQSSGSSYYDAGTQNLSLTGEQLAQYVLYRFDTSGSQPTLTLPSASDILSQISSPTVGQVFIIAITAEGDGSVSVAGGSGMNIRTSAATVPGNTTRTCILWLLIPNRTARR